MQLVPYLYSAFVRYHLEGTPPFRALVIDYPDDPQTWALDSQYLAGESLLVAPVVAGEHDREVYLPAGEWFDFWTGVTLQGGRRLNVSGPLDQIPVFVKAGTLLPFAQPTLHTEDAGAFSLTMRAYGRGDLQCTLYEDDGSVNPAFTMLTLGWDGQRPVGTMQRSGPATGRSYVVKSWESVAGTVA